MSYITAKLITYVDKDLTLGNVCPSKLKNSIVFQLSNTLEGN